MRTLRAIIQTARVDSLVARVQNAEQEIVACLVLVFLGTAVFASAIFYVPTNHDDLILLSSVATTDSPWRYFASDWGLGNYAYRPLHSLSLWLTYRLVGVYAPPHQAINLALHLGNTIGLYLLLRKVRTATYVAFLMSALFLINPYTQSAASWVSDRSILIVLGCLLILLHFGISPRTARAFPSSIGALSVIALLAKESGIVVPLVGMYLGWERRAERSYRWGIAMALGVLVAYGGLRLVIFSKDALSYAETGYLAGLQYYSTGDWAAFPSTLKAVSWVDNVVKQFVGSFVPVFVDNGGFLFIRPQNLIDMAPLIVGGIVLSALGLIKRLTRMQRIALIVLVLNALVHFAAFRYKNLYIAQAMFVTFVGSAAVFTGDQQPPSRYTRFTRFFVGAVAVVLVLYSTLIVTRFIDHGMVGRLSQLDSSYLDSLVRGDPTYFNRDLVSEVWRKYEHLVTASFDASYDPSRALNAPQGTENRGPRDTPTGDP